MKVDLGFALVRGALVVSWLFLVGVYCYRVFVGV